VWLNIYIDSRQIKAGDVFVAVPGEHSDGRYYIKQAIQNGASLVYYEAQGDVDFMLPDTQVPLVPIENLSAKLGAICAEFYDYPSKALTVIGVTGTNGKTSITHFLGQALSKTAILGTMGVGTVSQLTPLNNTTPVVSEVHRLLRECTDLNFKYVAMEVSSHALMQHRVDNVAFDIAVFTNLTRDHLDYHGSMEHYAAAKQRLFEWPELGAAVINLDDPYGQQMLAASQAKQALSYAMHVGADIQLQQVESSSLGYHIKVDTPWGVVEATTALMGEFNVSNVLAVIGVLGLCGLGVNEIAERIASLVAPPGRMSSFSYPNKPAVIVDFAHTPDALENVLQTLRSTTKGAVWCVFGCGGDRDVGKRSLMGEVASRLSDHVVITDDNPRTESPQHIVDHILSGVVDGCEVRVIHDRSEAIRAAIKAAALDDVVLIAGKGHENYQVIGDEKQPFSDSEVVRESLE
jgi:UDP-N-acetylmuramoyl-L-alanyl-D-glutamate--2,6-diaminopimelate ligase